MGTLLLVVVGLFAGLGGLAFLFAIYVAGEAWYYQVLLAPAFERGLGFPYATTCRTTSRPAEGARGYISASSIHSIADGGVFARAGFRAGDVLPEVDKTDLCKQLHRYRGRETELAVVDGGPGPPFHWRPRRVI